MKRAYVTALRLAELSESLSEIDWAVLRTLRLTRVATARQLCRLHCAHFAASSRQRQCARLLARLADGRLVARLDRQIGGVRAGSAGFVYSLDYAGHRLLDERPKRVHTPGLLFLRHSLAITELHVSLVEAERAGRFEMLEFQAEPTAWRAFTEIVGRIVLKPDAFARLGVGSDELAAFVEIDLATESTTALARKFDLYRRYWACGIEQQRHGLFPSVIWLVPNDERRDVVMSVAGRQPADSWQLYRVALLDEAVSALST